MQICFSSFPGTLQMHDLRLMLQAALLLRFRLVLTGLTVHFKDIAKQR